MWPAACQDNPQTMARAACTPEICPERALNAAYLAKAAKKSAARPQKWHIFDQKWQISAASQVLDPEVPWTWGSWGWGC